MSILNAKTDEIGESGVVPRIIRIQTNDTYATITSTGYLNSLPQKFGISLRETDFALVTSKTSPSAEASSVHTFEVQKSGSNYSLIATDDFNGPASSTDNAVARWNGTSGNALQDSGIIVNDSDEITGVTNLTVDNINVNGNTINADSGDLNLTSSAGSVTAPTPTVGTGVANKDYVDSLAAGLSYYFGARVATTVDLSATYDNGASGVGATLTAGSNGAISVDGVALDVGDYLLVKNQSTASENGYYLVTTQGDVSNPFVLTRAANNDSSSEFAYGDSFGVVEGTINEKTFWQMNVEVNTVGTDPITYQRSIAVFPSSSTDNAIPRFDGTDGKALQDSSVTIDDTGNIAGVASIDINSSTVIDGFIDDDTFASASATTGATSESIKAYVDNATSGSGDVSGPASSTDNALARFDSTTGKIIQNSNVTLSDAGIMAGIDRIDLNTIKHDGDFGNEIDFSNDEQHFQILGSDRLSITTDGIALVNPTDGETARVNAILDEDDMVSDRANALATQQSIKAFVEAQPGKIIQYTTSTSTAVDTTSATSLSNTSVAGSITPTSAGNTIIVMVSVKTSVERNTGSPLDRRGQYDVRRTGPATSVISGGSVVRDGRELVAASSARARSNHNFTLICYDTAVDTTSHTYTLRFQADNTDLLVTVDGADYTNTVTIFEMET